MYRISLVVFSLALAVNSQAKTPQKTLDISPDFLPYVLTVKRLYTEINHEPMTIGKLAIRRGELVNRVLGTDADAVGECSRGIHTITIGSWSNYGECQKEELITHELGHCLFEMDHAWGGFMAPQMHSEAICKLNLESFRMHFYKSAKTMRAWQKKRDKAKKEFQYELVIEEVDDD